MPRCYNRIGVPAKVGRPLAEEAMLRPATVLIIDDLAASREALVELLGGEGYELLLADGGATGLELARRRLPDLILLDMILPDLDGLAVCRRLRAAPPTARVPVLFVTAPDDRAARLAGIAAGCDDFVTWPLDRFELRLRVRAIVGLNRYRLLYDEQLRCERLFPEPPAPAHDARAGRDRRRYPDRHMRPRHGHPGRRRTPPDPAAQGRTPMSAPPRPLSRAGQPAHVVIADDHDLARAGLRAVFDDTRDLLVVGEAADGDEAVALCRVLQPGLAVLDVRMPRMSGLEATGAIKAICPRTSVLLVSFHADPEYIVEALRLGAAGYLLKDTSREQILGTARRALRGEALLCGDQAAGLLRRAAAGGAREQPPRTSLTAREHQVLRLVTEGRTNREIAADLKISPGTVKNHVEHIIAKLDVSDRTQAAVYALRFGLLAG